MFTCRLKALLISLMLLISTTSCGPSNSKPQSTPDKNTANTSDETLPLEDTTSDLTPQERLKKSETVLKILNAYQKIQITVYHPEIDKTPEIETLAAERALAAIIGLNNKLRYKLRGNCRTYMDTLNRTFRESRRGLAKLNNDLTAKDELLWQARLRILNSTLSIFKKLWEQKKAGGITNLYDFSKSQGCDFEVKEEWEDKFNLANSELNKVLESKFGSSKFYVSNFLSKVEEEKVAELSQESTNDWLFIGGSIVVSLLLWKFIITGLAVKGIIKFAVFFMIGTAEMGAYQVAHFQMLMPETEWLNTVKRPQQFISSQLEWENFMEQSQDFVSTNVDSPVIYSQYLWMEHKMLSQAYLRFLERNESILVLAQEKFGSIEKAIVYYNGQVQELKLEVGKK